MLDEGVIKFLLRARPVKMVQTAKMVLTVPLVHPARTVKMARMVKMVSQEQTARMASLRS